MLEWPDDNAQCFLAHANAFVLEKLENFAIALRHDQATIGNFEKKG